MFGSPFSHLGSGIATQDLVNTRTTMPDATPKPVSTQRERAIPPVKAAGISSLLMAVFLTGCSAVNFTGATATSTPDSPQTLVAAPTVTSQPANASVPLGQTATFSATATGTGTLNYQWRKDLANIAGATTPVYTVQATSPADSGSTFDVVVSNSAGSTTSNSATLLVTTPAQASYYVALNGSDTADGSASSPFATLQRAQRAMQQSAIKVTQINAGTYYLSSPLTLTEADQGETWEAVAGATVILSGGELLTGWTDQDNGIYSALAAKPVGLDLAIAGVRQIPAALGYDPLRPFISGWRVLNPNQPQNFGVTFTVPSTDMTSSVKPGATVQVLDFLRYSDQITTIVSVDQANSTITVAGQFNTGTTSPGVSGSWRVLNDPADLGAPGEFAYDAATAKVYIDPANPDSLTSDPVVAATLSTLIVLNNVSGVTISGLTLSDTTSNRNYYSGMFTDKLAAIMGTGLSNSTISGNTFVNVGNGISLSVSSNNSISGNSFSQIGGSGIFLTANSNRNNVTQNTMTGLGRINVGSTGVHLENSANNLVDSNTIDGSGRWGIDLFPSDGVSLTGNTVSNNVIRNTSQQTNDTGAI